MAYINDPRCIRIEGDHLGVSSLFAGTGTTSAAPIATSSTT